MTFPLIKRPSARPLLHWAGAASLCLLLLPAVAGPARAAPAASSSPADGIRSFYNTLLSTMKEGPRLGQRGRYARLAPVVQKLFDVPYMTRLAVGPSWSSLTPSQQQEVTEAFGHYLSAVYADRFDNYSGEKLEVLGEHPYGADVIVETRIVKSDGEPVAINYLMHRQAGSWQVIDIYLEGTVSQMATQRSEFYSILRRHGIAGLIAELNRKVQQLNSNPSGSAS